MESSVGEAGEGKGWTDAGTGSLLVRPCLKKVLFTAAVLEDRRSLRYAKCAMQTVFKIKGQCGWRWATCVGEEYC